MEFGKDYVFAPVRLGLRTGMQIGSKAIEGAFRTGKQLSGDALRLVDSKRLGLYLQENHESHDKEGIEREIVDRQDDFALVDLNAERHVYVSIDHSEGLARTGEEVSGPHIQNIQEFMVKNRVSERTIEKAVERLKLVIPHTVTANSRIPGIDKEF